tara:strand:+ start:30 stop:494 length:465 start_codon:yes stop_codon:yes gene_type:complete
MSQKQWGNITWILFHSLAESIDPNLFIQAKPLVILFINNTCKNLPCPICSEHAVSLMKSADVKNITSKADLIEFLRQFHNIVNINTNKENFEKIDIIKKYKNPKILLIISEFNKIYSVNYNNFNTNSMIRSNNRKFFLQSNNNLLKQILKFCKL